MIGHLIQSLKFIAFLTCLVKIYAKIAVTRKVKFCDHNFKQEPDKNKKISPSPLTERPEDSLRTSEDDEKRDKNDSTSHSSERYSSRKDDSSKEGLEDYIVDRHDLDPSE